MRALISFFALFTLPGPVWAQETVRFAHQSDLDHVWLVTAAALVFLMQAGFLLLEAGTVRSKNSVNVAQKNLMDFLVSVVVFGCVGFMLMFGNSAGGWVGWQPQLLFFGSLGDWSLTFFIFQLMFCGTAATILSGAVAERMSINGYLACTLMIAAVVYPVAGHWAWGGLLSGSELPFLASLGFMDFAGSTVVHGVGAWVALAAVIILGPRIGKFDANGKPVHLHGYSPALATVGAIILWVGWIGFNGGSMLAGTDAFAQVVFNTIVAAGGGGVCALVVGRLSHGVFKPDASINGTLGGLVAITAGADVVSSQAAFVIGLTGAIVVFAATWIMESLCKLDDPLGAIAVHGGAGLWGTLAIPFFAPVENLLLGNASDQFVAQLTGTSLIFAWAFGVSFAFLKAFDLVLRFWPGGGGHGLRVPEDWELAGLNEKEHDAPMGTGILQRGMAEIAFNFNGRAPRLSIEIGDEAYETGQLFNRILDNIDAARADEERAYNDRKARNAEIEAEIGAVVEACVVGDFSKRLATEGRHGFMLELCNGINALSETAETALGQVHHSLAALAGGDATHTIVGDYRGTLGDIQTAMNTTLSTIRALVEEVDATVVAAGRGNFQAPVDLEGKKGVFAKLCEEINALCEISENGLMDVLRTLQEVGAGDLTARMSDGYTGRFNDLSQAVNGMAHGIAALVRAVKMNADAVALGCDGIRSANEAVRAGSEDQLTQLGAADRVLGEVTDTASKTMKRAAEAETLCKAASETSNAGKELAVRTKTQILEIQEATAEIFEAVKLIDAISTQTKMLSLNASVEAVRGGGEVRKDGVKGNEGFKVVAQEVRDLAGETTEAVSLIRDKAEFVKQAVEGGVDLVAQTTKALQKIDRSLQECNEKVGRLSADSTVQSSRVAAVNAELKSTLEKAQDNLERVVSSTQMSQKLEREAAKTTEYLSQFTLPGSDVEKAA